MLRSPEISPSHFSDRKSTLFTHLITYLLPQTPRRLLFLAGILIHILVVVYIRRNFAGEDDHSHESDCPYGRIFVYDLPPEFNSDLVKNCSELLPWGSKCSALSENGFGRSAVDLAGILPEVLTPAWHWTDQFSLEIIFHYRVMNYKCRTLRAEEAKAFYIPFYAGLCVGKHLWTPAGGAAGDGSPERVLSWVGNQSYWRNSGGWDHFLPLGRITWDFRRSKPGDWGSSFIHMPEMRNVTRLLIERNPWDYFDVGVPYPTGFHAGSVRDVTRWQSFVRTRRRASLFSFVGSTRRAFVNDFRGFLLSYCRNESRCRAVDCALTHCAEGDSAILEAFLDSEFCLQPRGDSFTRRSVFDCWIAGSIPVFFWRRSAYLQYQWFLPEEEGSYSVFIDRNAVKNGTSIRRILEKYGNEEVARMREKVVEYIPRIIYAKTPEGLGAMKDAVDIALEGVLKRMKDQEGWQKWR